MDQFISMGDFFICRSGPKITFYEFNACHRHLELGSIERTGANFIYHVPTHVNKILICTNEGMEVYNFVRNKTVFHTSKIQGCRMIEASPIIDVVAAVCDSAIHLYNIKSDKIRFSLKYEGNLKRLSFHTNGSPLLMAVIDDSMHFFHLEEQRWVVKLDSHVLDACFLEGEDILAVRKIDGIKLMVLENYKIRVLKERIFFGKVTNFDRYEENLILSTEHGIYSASLLSDELNFRFKVKNFTEPETIRVGSENIVTANRSCILFLSHEDKNSQVVMESYRNSFLGIEISNCGNFGVVRTESAIAIHNLKSKLIYREIPVEPHAVGMAFDILSKRIVICYLTHLLIISDKYERSEVPLDAAVRAFKYHNGFAVLATADSVVLYDIENKVHSRVFMCNDIAEFSVSEDLGFIAISTRNAIQVYDIRTQKLVDTLNVKSSKVVFTPFNRYLCVLNDGNVDLYFNNSIFNQQLALPRFNQQIEEVQKEVCGINEKIEGDFFLAQKELNHILLGEKYPADLEGVFNREYARWNETYEAAVAYMEFESKNNIL